MSLTWTDMEAAAQLRAKDNNSTTLTQLKQDMNTGYHLFNAKLSRYFSRKQQFTDLVASQQIYQTPIDCVRMLGMTVLVSNTYQPPVMEIRSEFEWRQITSVGTSSNWPMWYFAIGNDELSLWPIPSQTITNGLRMYYQPQTSDLSIEDVTSTSTSATVTVQNGSTTVTASSSVFNANMAGLSFQATGVPDLTFYEIISATSNTLTLKSAYVAPSASGLAWRVGQVSIIPQEYDEAPIHYALWNFFSANGNETRGEYHKTKFDGMVDDCLEEYSSSNVSSVVTDDLNGSLNLFLIPPPAS